ncbi:MAG TPA: DUF2723 domain-containing protein [Bacteroidota bacterium]|nr:DUF2723 domain-containing protein [Bacteroidota bacterium]
MNTRLAHRITAACVFAVSLVQFLLTVQPSVPFWDPGELSAAAYMLEVPHPPGGPLFSLIGRLFFMLPIPGDIGLRMNLISVVASALSILLLYLIIVKLIRSYKGQDPQTPLDAIGTFGAAAIGALAYSFSDSFWFSAVEANYFAASTLLYTLIVWLMLAWNEQAGSPGNGRYILLMTFLAGISAGVHLMSVPAILAVVMVIMFRKYVVDDEFCRQSAMVFVGHVLLLLVIAFSLWAGQTGSAMPSIEESHAFDVKFKAWMVVPSILVMGIFWKKVFNRSSFYMPVLAGGVAFAIIYPVVIKMLPGLLRSVADDNIGEGLIVLIAVLVALGFLAHWLAKEKMALLHTAVVGIMLATAGFTTYTMILIRSGKNPPMNENAPKTFSGLITYLDREQYGDFPIFKRRWSQEAHQQAIFTAYSSDLDFFWRYQMNHMFNRYLFWNYIGREGEAQDSGVEFKMLFGIPFALGLLGLYFHFRNDWKMASVFLVLFVIMGYLITFYQNQQEPQPRERDYFYPGAFSIFAVWIALGIRGIIDQLAKKFAEVKTLRPAVILTLFLALVFVPLRMLQANYHTHDRSKNWVPWDLSYNMLQTCRKDAVLFTNGDNDTFPLWYLQDVEGVRRDVRVICLSLANTSWYIQQMKDKPYYPEAQAVPISMSDDRIAAIQPIQWEPRTTDLPVSPDAIDRFGVTDTSILRTHRILWRMPNTVQYGQVKAIRVQDILMRDIILTNQWKRPIYIAVTCSPDAKLGLDEYLWFDGLAWQLEPKRVNREDLGVDYDVLQANLMQEPDGFSRAPQYGYKFRGVGDTSIFFDENASRLMSNYRSAFVRLAMFDANVKNDQASSAAVLDRMEQIIPRSKYPMGWELESDLALFYHRVGRMDKFNQLADDVEAACEALIAEGKANVNSYYNPYRVLLDLYDTRKSFRKERDLLATLNQQYPNTPELVQRLEAVNKALAADTTSHADSVH